MKCLCFDGSHTIFRNFHILKRNKSSRAEDLVGMVLKSVIKEAYDYQPNVIYVCWDHGRPKHRLELQENYKGDRINIQDTIENSEDDEEVRMWNVFVEACAKTHELLPQLGVRSIRVPNVEADDIAFFISTLYEEGRHLTEDKDWLLNINQHWELWRPITKQMHQWTDFKELVRSDEPRTKYLYMMAMMGGKNHVEGIPGVKWVNSLMHAQYLIDNVDLPDTAVGKKITEYKSLVERNLRIYDTAWLMKDQAVLDQIRKQSEVGDPELTQVKWSLLTGALGLTYESYWNKWKQVCSNLDFSK